LGLIDVLFAEEARLCSWWRWVEHQAVGEELVVRALCSVKETRTAQATRGVAWDVSRSEDLVLRSLDLRFAACMHLGYRRFVGKCSISQTPTSKSPEVVTPEPMQ
jgi:hypothetical protein